VLRDEKINVVEELKQAVQDHDVVIFTDIHGMKVAQMNSVRAGVRKAGGRFKVYKRRLAIRGLEELGIEGAEDKIEGSTGYCFLGEDVSAGAKALVDCKKEAPSFVFKGGIIQGKILDAEGIDRLAKMPSADVLRSQVVSGFAAPLYGLAYALSGLLRGLVTVLDGRKRSMEENSEEAVRAAGEDTNEDTNAE